MENIIKVGMLISYDWRFIINSLPIIYNHSDRIILALDKNRNTWSGNKFELSNDFFDFVKTLDKSKKIEIYEDDFYIPELSTLQNDTRERTMLANYMGKGGWHLQIDSDEYFIDFGKFANNLRHNYNKYDYPVDIFCNIISLFKKNETGYFFVKQSEDAIIRFPIATNFPNYKNARVGDNKAINTDFHIIHDTWARNEEELYKKLSNWGHTSDFNIESFFNFWKSLNKDNYKYIKDFHPLVPKFWHELGFFEAANIEELITKFSNDYSFIYSDKDSAIRLFKMAIKATLRSVRLYNK